MIRLLSSSHYFARIEEAQALGSLDRLVKENCAQPQRRIDRFIQLALIGSARCARAQPGLSAKSTLVVSTGIGPVGNNIQVQETLIQAKLLPKPFHFVNTLGSSTGFYVAKNLGLESSALFVCRRGGALDAALEVALSDLRSTAAPQVLLGTVEECTLPLSDHRRRLGFSSTEAVAEGSDWFLLERSETPRGRELKDRLFENWEALHRDLKERIQEKDRLLFSPLLSHEERASFSAWPALPELIAAHDSYDAAQLGRAFEEGFSGTLRWIGKSGGKAWKTWEFGAEGI